MLSLAPTAHSNYMLPTAIRKVRLKKQFDFCNAKGEDVRHNVSPYYNRSVPTAQRTVSSSTIKKTVMDVYSNTHINALYGDVFNSRLLGLCLYPAAGKILLYAVP